MPRIVPGDQGSGIGGQDDAPPVSRDVKRSARTSKSKQAIVDQPKPIRRNGLTTMIPLPGEILPEDMPAKPVKPAKPKAERAKKNDPQLVAKARELRDRYLEAFNLNPPQLSSGKYNVARLVDTNVTLEMGPKLIAA